MASPVSLSVLSLQFYEVTISADADPTVSVVKFAFTPSLKVPPSTYTVGAWKGAATSVVVNGVARFSAVAHVLVGPTSAVGSLPAGTWQPWVQVLATPELPVLTPAPFTTY